MRPSGIVLVLFAFQFAAHAAVDRAKFGFEQVRELAVQRAREAYQPPSRELPARIAELNYDDYRRLQFRPLASLWRESGLRFDCLLYTSDAADE